MWEKKKKKGQKKQKASDTLHEANLPKKKEKCRILSISYTFNHFLFPLEK